MFRTLLATLLLLAIQSTSFAQKNSGLETYRSAENPFYWKNNPPDAAYWQQDVHYEIEATIDDATDIIDGTSFRLTYYNNSPHTLNELYFHLFQEAFQPHSHYHALWEANKQHATFGEHEAKGLGTKMEDVRVNGQTVTVILDNTIAKVDLNTPLASGDSLVVTMKFKTYFDTGSMRRRMKEMETFGYKHYNGVHWYPSVAVYDKKFGWNTDQHLDKEFYHNFGQFDMALTFPQEYVVEATGVLMNREEVLPADLRQKLDISNFKDKPIGSEPSIITPKVAGKTKTWRYHAINVHNFAFTASPLYRIGEVKWVSDDGETEVSIITMAQEPNASGWQKSGAFTREVIRVNSEDFGMYAWPKIVVADAADGMEYPMLTLDAGTYPGHRRLLAHEVSHMWFYGMVGSNETYRAAMDEGFTQFLTVWDMNRITDTLVKPASPGTAFINRYGNLYYPYLKSVLSENDHPLNTHSSDFNSAIRQGGNYGLVYFKTGTMLYNLQYVLGNQLFQEAMQFYFDKWKMAHPYPEDFRDAIIEYTQVDLNWFFDQWLETTKEIDYAIKKVRKVEDGKHAVTFERKGGMQMPLDFIVIGKSGKVYFYHIPNTWFEKETQAQILPRWYGSGLLNQEYTAVLDIPEEIDRVEIDPALMMADIDRSNNTTAGADISLDKAQRNMPNWISPVAKYRPDIWYNSIDGLQLGGHIEGNYFGEKDIFSASLWYNSGLLADDDRVGDYERYPLSARLSYETSIRKLLPGTTLKAWGNFNTGLVRSGLRVNKKFQKQDARNPYYTNVYVAHEFMIRPRTEDTIYLLYPRFWSSNERLNSFTTFGVERHYEFWDGQKGQTNFELRTAGLVGDFAYSHLQMESLNDLSSGNWKLKSRIFGRFGHGAVPRESALYAAGANPEELDENKFTRARGFVPEEWLGYGSETNHFHHGGGLNLRGYAGRAFFTESNAEVVGRSGLSFNAELQNEKIKLKLSRYLSFQPYLFGDVGSLSFVNDRGYEELGKVLADAGIGAAMTVSFGSYDIKPFTLRCDLPLFVSEPGPGEENLDFRFVVGVGRAF